MRFYTIYCKFGLVDNVFPLSLVIVNRNHVHVKTDNVNRQRSLHFLIEFVSSRQNVPNRLEIIRLVKVHL